MYSPGHVGSGLALFAPVGSVVLPAVGLGPVAAGLLVVTAASVLPDVDQHLSIPHRGPTHSVAFVALVTLVAAIVGGTLADQLASAPVVGAGIVGVATMLGTGSHLAIDGVTPMGIRPWWPVSDRRYTLDLVPSGHRALNAGLLAIGVAATVALFTIVHR